ncbi:hypothetical protein N9W89_13420 [Hellea sp.]|nr:hypothetical protein [Hellea sp.]
MKKLAIGGGIAIILLLVVFFWLLSGASADNAPQDVQTIELPDSYEK